MAVLEEIYESLIEGDLNGVTTGVNKALEEDINVADILNKSLIAGMGEVGRLFEEGEYFVPEMLISARAMQAGVAILKPKLLEADIEPLARVVIGTVKGDLHDIGKNLVAMMLEGAGFEIIDVGTDVAPEKFVDAIKEYQPQVVGLSGFLTLAFDAMKETVAAIESAGLRDEVKIMIGGGQINEEINEYAGADGYGRDAMAGVSFAKKWVNHK